MIVKNKVINYENLVLRTALCPWKLIVINEALRQQIFFLENYKQNIVEIVPT